MSVPGAAGGTRLASLASTLDIVPTVLDAVKVSYPPGLSGRSLLPALMGRTTPIRERLLAQTTEASPRPSTRVSS
jgi:arylsulfatase A-like enzyme